ncbi:MAG: hypothetical protein MJE68_26755 [Proteobacteria bacterium]|nr:hypothetical protein [Pseudomonadota bacterium]
MSAFLPLTTTSELLFTNFSYIPCPNQQKKFGQSMMKINFNDDETCDEIAMILFQNVQRA